VMITKAENLLIFILQIYSLFCKDMQSLLINNKKIYNFWK
jgi:hypothetical protein